MCLCNAEVVAQKRQVTVNEWMSHSFNWFVQTADSFCNEAFDCGNNQGQTMVKNYKTTTMAHETGSETKVQRQTQRSWQSPPHKKWITDAPKTNKSIGGWWSGGGWGGGMEGQEKKQDWRLRSQGGADGAGDHHGGVGGTGDHHGGVHRWAPWPW